MLRTKRWCDPVEADDGFRVLIARYRPRGVAAADETWSGFMPQLGPSKALHAAFYAKPGSTPVDWEQYRARYVEEMRSQQFWIRNLAELHARGETVTLLCSSACTDASRCHRTLLRALIEAEAPPRDRIAAAVNVSRHATPSGSSAARPPSTRRR